MLNKILLIATLSIQANADTVWDFVLAEGQWTLFESELALAHHYDGSIAGQFCRVPDAIDHEIFADVNSGELVLLMTFPHELGALEVEGQMVDVQFEINSGWGAFLLREPGSEGVFRKLEQRKKITVRVKHEPSGKWVDLSMNEKNTWFAQTPEPFSAIVSTTPDQCTYPLGGEQPSAP